MNDRAAPCPQEKARIKLKKHKTKYAFIDIGKNLRDRDINLTLVWVSPVPLVSIQGCRAMPHLTPASPAGYNAASWGLVHDCEIVFSRQIPRLVALCLVFSLLLHHRSALTPPLHPLLIHPQQATREPEGSLCPQRRAGRRPRAELKDLLAWGRGNLGQKPTKKSGGRSLEIGGSARNSIGSIESVIQFLEYRYVGC